MSDDREDSIFDRNTALARIDGDAALFADLAQLFCEESDRMLSAVQAAVEAKNADELHRAAHFLKGSVATFAAKPALDAALKLEAIARSGDLSGADAAAVSLAEEIRRLRVALEMRGKDQSQREESLR